MYNLKKLTFLALMAMATTVSAQSQWHIENIRYNPKTLLVPRVKIRAGYLKEEVNNKVSFKGNILYLQGLADSMLNHRPLFNMLTKQGYRVITFDYMGQGGSTGTMNHTRIIDPTTPSLEIRKIAQIVWNKFANKSNNKRTIIGWSTGGLAAYQLAHSKWADTVILFAPGICANTSVGEGILKGNKITLRTLTSNSQNYDVEENPHLDPIKPSSPLVVPMFSVNLLANSLASRHWDISKDVNGLIFHSGKEDNYVNSNCNRRVIDKNASHFHQESLDGALHEIDNEIPEIREQVFKVINDFLNSI